MERKSCPACPKAVIGQRFAETQHADLKLDISDQTCRLPYTN